MVVDSEREYEMRLGRAVDALKSDYPTLLTDDPDWGVYHPRIEVVDPTGVRMTGLENYKMAFGFVHGVVKWFYCEERSRMTSVRVGYDWARKCIRCVLGPPPPPTPPPALRAWGASASCGCFSCAG